MKNLNVAKVYASAFIQICDEAKIDIAKELTTLTETINASNDLENVLFLEVFTNEEKTSVFEAIAEKIKLSKALVDSIKYIITEKRINLLPLITKEIIVIDDAKRGFIRGTIEGSTSEVSEEMKNKLVAALKSGLAGKEPILEYKKNDSITAGYKITVGDLQVDATIDNQLKAFKEAVLDK